MYKEFWNQSPEDRLIEITSEIAYEMADQNPEIDEMDYQYELQEMNLEKVVEMYNKMFDEDLTAYDICYRHPED